jgi:hypothetical protein
MDASLITYIFGIKCQRAKDTRGHTHTHQLTMSQALSISTATSDALIIDLTADSESDDERDAREPKKFIDWPQQAVVAVIKLTMSKLQAEDSNSEAIQSFVWVKDGQRHCIDASWRISEDGNRSVQYDISTSGTTSSKTVQSDVGNELSQGLEGHTESVTVSQDSKMSAQSAAGAGGSGIVQPVSEPVSHGSEPVMPAVSDGNSSWSQESITTDMVLSGPAPATGTGDGNLNADASQDSMMSGVILSEPAPVPVTGTDAEGAEDMEVLCTPGAAEEDGGGAASRIRKKPERWTPDATNRDTRQSRRARPSTSDCTKTSPIKTLVTRQLKMRGTSSGRMNAGLALPIRTHSVILKKVEESHVPLAVPTDPSSLPQWVQLLMCDGPPLVTAGVSGGNGGGAAGTASTQPPQVTSSQRKGKGAAASDSSEVVDRPPTRSSSQIAANMTVYVTINDDAAPVRLSPCFHYLDTIASIRNCIEEELNISCNSELCLFKGGRDLSDHMTLESCG